MGDFKRVLKSVWKSLIFIFFIYFTLKYNIIWAEKVNIGV